MLKAIYISSGTYKQKSAVSLKYLNIRNIFFLVYVSLLFLRNCNYIILIESYIFLGNKEKTNEYTTKWLKRQRALRDVLWNPDRGVWQDLDIEKMSHRDYFYASNISPLYASCIGNEVQLTEDSVLDYLQVWNR